jgi:hypothetical protein
MVGLEPPLAIGAVAVAVVAATTSDLADTPLPATVELGTAAVSIGILLRRRRSIDLVGCTNTIPLQIDDLCRRPN